jgi:signal transduction histidine kinase
LAEGRAEEPAKRREYALFLVQETRRLGTLVENVLDFSRIEQGRKVYVPEPIHLPRLVRETVRILAPVAGERDVALNVEVMPEGEGFEVSADAAALQQALLNLVDNALKHAPAGSVVEVRLERGTDPKRPVRLAVRDAGPGIPAEDHQRIFERFYRRGSELRRETQGVGLGLAIVRHVVEGHGGRVWVESEPGRGAVFFVELPVDGREVKS